eukprot:13683457-Ditylum_brightwellii.AAC.1
MTDQASKKQKRRRSKEKYDPRSKDIRQFLCGKEISSEGTNEERRVKTANDMTEYFTSQGRSPDEESKVQIDLGSETESEGNNN